MDAFGSAGRLADVAGLAPVPRDSGLTSYGLSSATTTHRRVASPRSHLGIAPW
ncbi:hypothetical protein KGS77_02555 [Streptomyces sp. MST-110588]|nr:hypothetical protein KGS77_02555 [Streptomyces sp. MST-110588]